MDSPPFADPSDVVAAWRLLSDDEEAQAATLLAYTAALIRRQFSTIDASIESGAVDAGLPRMVAVEMVTRVLRNPDGAAQVVRTVGPFS